MQFILQSDDGIELAQDVHKGFSVNHFKFRHISEIELDQKIWRYLTFSKYVSLITYRAIWFSKLKILIDEYEGAMPAIADREMREEFLSWKIIRDNPQFAEQIRNANQRNVDDGRELMLANCWFCDDNESAEMWKVYAEGVESVAITSTIRRLSEHVYCDPQFSLLGRVQYVDHASYEMSHYEANQAGERAFLKDNSFSREKEVRMVTMSVKGPMCVNEDGTDMVPAQYDGARMNNFENPGLYIKTDLPKLVTQTILAPHTPKWFELLVKRIAQLSGVGGTVARSQLE